MNKAEAKKPSIFKAVAVGMAAYIVRTSIVLGLSRVMSDSFAVNVIASVITIIVGGAYYNYCIQPLGNRVRIFDNRKLPVALLLPIAFVAISGFIISGWFLYGGAFGSNEIIAESVEMFRNSSQTDNTPIVSYWIYAILIAPVVEEIIYRGFFFRSLYEVSKPTAYYMSVLFFAVTHGNIIQMIVAALGGVMYSMIYVKTKSLRICIAAHMLYNLLALGVAFLGAVLKLDVLDNPGGFYNAFAVSLCVALFVASLMFLRSAPVGLEIPRPKTLTPEELLAKAKHKEEFERISREIEEEKKLEREREESEREARRLALVEDGD